MSDISCEWYLDASKFDYEKERKKAFLLPQWGIYICAYSRMRILSSISMFGEGGRDACYSDTDSIKYVGDHDDVIDIVNRQAQNNMKKVCNLYGLDHSIFWDLGSFEKEYGGQKVTAKFLGAKRYIVKEGNDYHVTIAGLPKKALQGHINKLKLQHEIYEYGAYPEMFDIFTNKMLLSADVSLKNAHSYNDEPHAGTVDGVQCYELSSVGIYPIDFTMNLKEFYLTLIAMYEERSEHLEDRIY